jgi:hypothetical protein
MDVRFTVTDAGDVTEVLVTDDGKVIVTTTGTQVKPGEAVATAGGAAPASAAQYVWGATNIAERAHSQPAVRVEVDGKVSSDTGLVEGERDLHSGLFTE